MNQTFASYMNMPLIPYNIIVKLLTDTSQYAENIWKLLKYTNNNPLEEANLTYEEKYNMLWTPTQPNSTQQNLFNVFLKPLVSSSLNTDMEQTQLRIHRYQTEARSQYSSVMLFQFDIIVNENSCMVYTENGELVERSDMIEAHLLEILSGYDVGVGVNFLRFDRISGGTSRSILNINNSKSLYGRSLLLSLSYVDTSKGGDCSG